MSAGRMVAVAHRAGNRLDDLRAAEALGVDLVEADVHWFFGRLEVRHAKTIGPLPILWERWRLINPFTPRMQLMTLLAAAAPGTELMLDLKGLDPRLARRVAAIVTEYADHSPLTVSARNWWLLRPFATMAGVRRLRSVGSRFQLWVLMHLTRVRLDGVSIHESLLDATTIRSLHRRTDLILAWGIPTCFRLEQLRELGLDGAITDDTKLLDLLIGSRSTPDRDASA